MSKKPPQKVSTKRPKTSRVSLCIFLATLAVMLISLTSVLFPTLVIRSTSQFNDVAINPYETGVWTYPVLAANLVLLVISVLYFKNKLPQPITKSIRFIFDFEVSKKTAFVIVAVLIAVYVAFTASELATEEKWDDYPGVKDRVKSWTASDVTKSFEPHLRYLLLSASLNLFGNIRVLPFVVSIALLVVTYYITKEISKKRFAGLVAMSIVLQSSVFLSYDTSATYDNLWILLYLLSLYMIYKKWPLSPISYVLSISSKALTAMFLPMTFFFIYRADMQKQKKIRTAISYGAIAVIGIAISIAGVNIAGSSVGFNANEFWRGFTSWAFQLRFDGLILIFILPLVFGLFALSRRGVVVADSIMIFILVMLLTAPLLQGFTDLTNQPYRFVPLIVFFAMGVGTILSKTSEQA